MIEYIKSTNGTEICVIIRNTHKVETTEFYTPQEYSQQLGIIKYAKNGIIKPHIHNKLLREVYYTQEVLVIRKGKVKVNLYDNDLVFLESKILEKGDVILLASGGHGFEMLEDSEMLEIKQGPYNGVTNDKTHF